MSEYLSDEAWSHTILQSAQEVMMFVPNALAGL